MLRDPPGVGVFNIAGEKAHIIAVAVRPESITKELKQGFFELAKTYGSPTVERKTGVLRIKVTGLHKKKRIEKLDAASVAMPSIISQLRLELLAACVHCGRGDTDTYIPAYQAPSPVHSTCEQAVITQMIEEIEESSLNGNYGTATVAALLGAVVGAIPAFIGIYVFDYFVGELFAIVPLGAAFAYRKARGIESRFMTIIIAIWSIIASVLLMLVNFYVYTFGWWWGMMTLDGVTIVTPLNIFFELLLSNIEYVILDMGMALVFCGLGISISWGYMSHTNKAKIKALQAKRDAVKAAHNETINH